MGIPLYELHFHIWILVIWCVTCSSRYFEFHVATMSGVNNCAAWHRNPEGQNPQHWCCGKIRFHIFFIYYNSGNPNFWTLWAESRCVSATWMGFSPSRKAGRPMFRRVVQEYMHGPYEEGANSTSALVIHMLKFNGTSYVIASIATAYLFPIKLILTEVRCLMAC